MLGSRVLESPGDAVGTARPLCCSGTARSSPAVPGEPRWVLTPETGGDRGVGRGRVAFGLGVPLCFAPDLQQEGLVALGQATF